MVLAVGGEAKLLFEDASTVYQEAQTTDLD